MPTRNLNAMFQSFGCSSRLSLSRLSSANRFYTSKHGLTKGTPDSTPAKIQMVPPPKVHRVTYEYPPPPKRSQSPPIESSAWKRHIPLAVGIGGLLWAGYAIYYFFGDSGAKEQTVLNPSTFSTFRITHKETISDDTIMIELAPKYAASASMLKSGATLWNGKKIWSVQVKHPMIQIARHYTPLPLYYMQSDRPQEPPLLRIMGKAEDEGKLCLLVKRYADGEMSRYLHALPVGSDVELRGPFIEHSFAYESADSQKLRQPMLDIPSRMPPEPELDPDSSIVRASNIAMFTAGTGITTALQVLLSPHNPPRGLTHVFHSARSKEDIPFERFMLFLESAGRAKFHLYTDDRNKFIGPKDIPDYSSLKTLKNTTENEVKTSDGTLTTPKYQSVVQQFANYDTTAYLPGISHAVVCGPPGYITYISGDPGPEGDNPISGLLGTKGWTLRNTARLIDI